MAYGTPNNTIGYKDGYGTNALFKSPVGISVTRSGSYFLGDLGNSRLRIIGTDGKVSSLIGNGNAVSMDGLGQAASFSMSTYWSMAVDENGTFYVSESGIVGSNIGSVIRQISCVPCMQVCLLFTVYYRTDNFHSPQPSFLFHRRAIIALLSMLFTIAQLDVRVEQ